MDYPNRGAAAYQTQDPKTFVVDPSTLKPMLMTVFSLISFAVAFAFATVGFARNLDAAGFVAYVMRDDTLAGISALWATGWLVYRTWVSRKKAAAINEIVPLAPNAVFKGETPLPDYARETVTGDGSVPTVPTEKVPL